MPLGSPDPVAAAWRDAEAAALHSGVVIRTVASSAEAREVSRLLAELWPLPGGASPVEPNFAWALAHSGNYVSLAWSADGSSADGSRAVGACVAFFGPPLQPHAHSHIAGIVPDSADRGIGLALKLHQRAWSLERGVHDIGWTFDPLISRNAHFNLVRLGAVVTEYLPDFYGRMSDARNGGQRSDRLMVSWPLDRSTGGPSDDGREHPALVRVANGLPSLAQDAAALASGGTTASLLIPDDVEALRAEHPAAAVRWRDVVGEALSMTVGGGQWQISAFRRGTGYLLEKTT